MDSIATVGGSLVPLTAPIESTRPRHPVIRTGDREPIDPYKRRLIYIRDGYACQWCGFGTSPDDPAPGEVLQLDHVIPWSAGGSDRSDNLRTLCATHNEQRSNYVDPNPPRLVGVASACYWCARRRNELPEWCEDADPADLPRYMVFCGCCSATSWVPRESWIM